MVSVGTDYLSVGGNRHPSAADWDSVSGLLAFGADVNVALWNPFESSQKGIQGLLGGHTDKVNVVKFFTLSSPGQSVLLTGSVDHTIKIWQRDTSSHFSFKCVSTLEGHLNSVTCLSTAEGSNLFASGSADGTVKIWKLDHDPIINVTLLQTISLSPRYFPLALALSMLNGARTHVLAIGGTRSAVQIYVTDAGPGAPVLFELKTTLTGHDAWIRSLSFALERQGQLNDLLLASASQDKYIRLWRLHGDNEQLNDNTNGLSAELQQLEISDSAHRFEVSNGSYSFSFEALLLGHEDWIYSTCWNPSKDKLQLLSASADTSVAIWEPDIDSGVWVCVARLGGISSQKGSTSATGSTGGFWTGLWSPNGSEVVSLGKAGSWRLWRSDPQSEEWVQEHGVTGHVKAVTGIAWEDEGDYLLSTSSDQTTRLHAQWRREGATSWHELARPQIHGYDLNCIGSLGPRRFISGADEKLLRVFNEPRATAELLANLNGSVRIDESELPDAANMPVLGLSNKAIQIVEDPSLVTNDSFDKFENDAAVPNIRRSDIALDRPPTEDQLARHTLWPELEKLYGHGYEISAVAGSHNHSLVATACKSSSIDHAVIRLYETTEWHEIKPSLKAHSLTVTSLSFSGDDKYLLSVGRDRQWAIFQRTSKGENNYNLLASNPKGHSRMILDAAWAPSQAGTVFATAGRDKSIKIWSLQEGADFVCKVTISVSHPVTAITFLPTVFRNGSILLAVGEESGLLSAYYLEGGTLASSLAFVFPKDMCPSKSITKISWRPRRDDTDSQSVGTCELAVASEDCSLRLFAISGVE